MKFQGTDKERAPYTSKFLRVEDDLLVTEPGDTTTSHTSLSWAHGVYQAIRRLVSAQPTSVDGGKIHIGDDDHVEVFAFSTDFGLPTDPAAREITGRLVQSRCPPGTIVDANLKVRLD